MSDNDTPTPLAPQTKLAPQSRFSASRADASSSDKKAKPDAASGENHALERKWTLYYDSPQTTVKGGKWGDHIKPVLHFETVEDFWR